MATHLIICPGCDQPIGTNKDTCLRCAEAVKEPSASIAGSYRSRIPPLLWYIAAVVFTWQDPRLQHLERFGLALAGARIAAAVMIVLDRRLNVWIAALYGALFPTVYVSLLGVRGLVEMPAASIVLPWLLMSALFGACALLAAGAASALAHRRLVPARFAPGGAADSLLPAERFVARLVGKITDIALGVARAIGIFRGK